MRRKKRIKNVLSDSINSFFEGRVSESYSKIYKEFFSLKNISRVKIAGKKVDDLLYKIRSSDSNLLFETNEMFHIPFEQRSLVKNQRYSLFFIFAVEMILDVEIFRNKGPEGGSAIIPIAFPLIAGPGSFTTLLSLRAEYATENIIAALILNMLFVFIVLKSTSKIEKMIGEGGIYILRKFFGIILLAIAVKLFTTNIGSLLK